MGARLALLVAVVAVAVGCGGTDDAADGEVSSLRVQAIPIAPVAPLFIGQQQGFFEEEGLEVEVVVNVQGGAANLAPVIAGDVDMGFSDLVPTIAALSTGIDLVSLTPASGGGRTEDTTYVVWGVRGDSPLQAPEELAGKSFATNTLGNITHLTLLATLEKHGVDPNSISIVILPFPALPSALLQGDVDVAQLVEPFFAQAKEEGVRPVLFPYVDVLVPGAAVSTFYTTRAWLDENEDVAERFRRAMNKSIIFASENPDEVRRAILEFSDIDPEIAEKMILPTWDPEGLNNTEGIERIAELMVQYGFIASIPDNLDQLIPPPVE